MKKIIFKTSILALLLSIAGVTYAQSPSTISLKSHLTDIEGTAVANAKIDASIIVLNSEGEKCFESKESIVTKDDGSFALHMQELPPVFTKGRASDPAVIQLTILSDDGDSWLEDDKFVVKYLFTIIGSSGSYEYSLTRMEGQKLNYEYATDIWKFEDIYPFAYIKSSFLVSFNKDITDAESLLLAAEALFKPSKDKQIDPAEATPAPSSRGIKGGAAVGGYKKDYGSDKKN